MLDRLQSVEVIYRFSGVRFQFRHGGERVLAPVEPGGDDMACLIDLQVQVSISFLEFYKNYAKMAKMPCQRQIST
jgi:hypothetical protein